VTGGPYYHDGSAIPAGAAMYAYVDSINYATSYGNIQESNEANNVWGPVLATAQVGGQTSAGPTPAPAAGRRLPER